MPRVLPAFLAALTLVVLTACGSDNSPKSSAGSSTSASPVLRVGTLTDARPNVYIDNGQFTGFDNDLLQAIAAKSGLRVQFVGTDFSALLAQVANGRFDIGSSAISVTDKRKQVVAFSNPYLVPYVGLLAKVSNPVTGYDTLSGRRVGVVTATIEDDDATQNFTGAKVVRFPDYNSVFAAVRSGAVDVWYLDEPIGRDYVAKNTAAKLKLVGVKPFESSPAAYAVKPGNTALLGQINAGLAAVIRDGTWVQLYKKYFPGAPVPKQFTAS